MKAAPLTEPATSDDPVRSAANIELLKSRLHDLANTIAGLQSGMELLDQTNRPPSPETLAALRSAALDARTGIQSLGDLLQGSEKRAEYFDVREQVELVLRLLRRSVPSQLHVEVHAPDDPVLANAPRHDFQVAAAEALLSAWEDHPAGDFPITITPVSTGVGVTIGAGAHCRPLTLPAL